MSTLFDTIFQTLKNKLPNISWKFGSVVRTLVADPLDTIGVEIDSYAAKLESRYDLAAILADPYNHEEELDAWIDRLNIKVPDNSASTGTVIIILTGKEPITIPQGSEFSWGDVAYVSVDETTNWGGVDGIPFKRVSNNLYQIEVAVSSLGAQPVTLTSGSPINWVSAPDRVVDIYVGSAITGGLMLTPEMKAGLVAQALENPSTCGRDAMLVALQRNFGPVITDVLNGPRKIEAGNSSCTAYIKQTELPRDTDIPVTPIDLGDGLLQCTIDTTGVVLISGVHTQSGELQMSSVTLNGELGDYGSKATIAFTAPATVTGFEYTYGVRVKRYNVLKGCAEWLNAYQVGSPAKIVAKTPALAELKMQLHIAGEEIGTSLREAIVDYINRSKLNSAITDSHIDTILASAGVVRTAPTLYTAKISYNTYQTTHTNTGSINVASMLGSPDTPVALYCGVNNIEIV